MFAFDTYKFGLFFCVMTSSSNSLVFENPCVNTYYTLIVKKYLNKYVAILSKEIPDLKITIF